MRTGWGEGEGDKHARKPRPSAFDRRTFWLTTPRYDALLVYCLVLTFGFWTLGLEMWRRFDLRVSGYRLIPSTIAALAIYANFFTHYWLPDVRWLLALLLVLVLRRCRVHFTVGPGRYQMPLSLSFVLIGAFLWAAENAATFLGAWRYPDQTSVWRVVHVDKLGAWALLVSLSFVLVASIKSQEGRLYHVQDAEPLSPAREAEGVTTLRDGKPGGGVHEIVP